jgi:hypothetical protein
MDDFESRKAAWIADNYSNTYLRRNSITDAELRRMHWRLASLGVRMPAEIGLILILGGRP